MKTFCNKLQFLFIRNQIKLSFKTMTNFKLFKGSSIPAVLGSGYQIFVSVYSGSYFIFIQMNETGIKKNC